jgi:hypothetical protein
MSLKTIATRIQLAQKIPLRLVLVVPFVLQIFAAVGLVGYFSLRNGQKAINDLAIQLQIEVSDRIDQHLDSYLATPHQINRLNANNFKLGLLNLQDFKGMGHYFWKQIQVFDVSYISLELLVASSATEASYTIVNKEAKRLKASESKDTLIRATAQHLSKHFGNLNKIKARQYLEFTLNGERQFAQITPWKDKYGLDWLIVVTIPESDFMGQMITCTNLNNRLRMNSKANS